MFGFTFGQTVFETEFGRIDPQSDVHFGLLLLVVAATDEGISRDDVCALLWPDSRLEQGRHNLRQALYRLRQIGIPVHLREGNIAYVGSDEGIDFRRLQNGLADRDELLRVGTLPFLPGYVPRLGVRYTAWLDSLRDRADGVRRRALAEAVRDARRRVCFPEVEKLARALLALDPLNETATLALAESIAMDGSKVEALRLLERYEEEVGATSEALRIPARTLRRRVSESLDEWLLPRRFEVPFVGRDEEFNELRELFLLARGGQSGVVILSGEAGIGKTRAASELLRLAVLDGARVITYTCASGDATTPLSSLLSLINSLLSQRGALGCAQEHLQYLRSIASPDANAPSPAYAMSAEVAYAQLVYSLSELVAAIVDEVPLVVFVDDAHRLHQMAWQVLIDVIDRLPAGRILLLIGTRQLPEWYSSLGVSSSERRARHVRLKPFGDAASLRFLAAWSEKNGVKLEEVHVRQFSATSGGNPFYLGEMAGHVGRGGDVAHMPASIRGLIEVQFAATSRSAQRVLLVISLLQARATMSRVTGALDMTASEFSDALGELEVAGLVTCRGGDVRVKHDMVAEACLTLAEGGTDSYVRARIATLLFGEGKETSNVELLADSAKLWEDLGDRDRATESNMRVGALLLARGLGRDALPYYARACELTSNSNEKGRAIDGCLRGASACLDWSTAFSYAAKARDLPAAIGGLSLSMRSLLVAESSYWGRGILPDFAYLQTFSRDRSLPAEERLKAAELLAIAADNFDDPKPIEHARSAVADLLEKDTTGNLDGALIWLIAAAVLGTPKEVAATTRRFTSHLEGRLVPAARTSGYRHAGTALLRVGRVEEADDYYRASLQLADELSIPHQTVSTLIAIARSALLRFDLRTFEAHVRRLVELSPSDSAFFAISTLFLQAELAWIKGDGVLAGQTAAALEGAPYPTDNGPWKRTARTTRVYIGCVRSDSLLRDDAMALYDELIAKPMPFLSEGPTLALIEALLRLDEPQKAVNLRKSYEKSATRHRGELTPLWLNKNTGS